jgi:mercuric ion transport protein
MKLAEPKARKHLSGTRYSSTATALSLTAGLAAALSATCCVLPLALSILGLGGAWLSFLGFFTEARAYIIAVCFLLLATSVVLLWRTRLIGPTRKTEQSRGARILVLASTALLLAAAVSAPLWEREATAFLWKIWISQ